MKFLYTDIDGVLNRHEQHPNGFTTMVPECLKYMNGLLNRHPDVQIVLSSAWRYQVHNGNMTMAGLEILLQTHGLDCYQRLHSITRSDEDVAEGQYAGSRTRPEWWAWLKENGARLRNEQILAHIKEHAGVLRSFAVVDDLALHVPRFVQCQPHKGMTLGRAMEIEKHLLRPTSADELRGWV